MINRTFFLIVFQLFLLQNASASFQDNLFKEIIDENKGENVIFSPLSLYQVISLVLNGAGGKTREEVFKVLFPDKDLDEQLIKDVNSNIEKIITDIESENNGEVDNKVIFNNVNALFHQEGISFKDEFKQICTQYNTSYFKLESVEQVNNYVSEHTNGKITDFLKSIDGVLFMIINALYFKGSWDKKFDESLTKKGHLKMLMVLSWLIQCIKNMKMACIMKMKKSKFFLYPIAIIIYHIKWLLFYLMKQSIQLQWII